MGPSLGRADKPEDYASTTEPQLSDQADVAENIQSGELQALPTVQQRRYSIDWDPIQYDQCSSGVNNS